MRVLLRAYRAEFALSVILLGVIITGLILSGLWWLLLILLGLGLALGAVVLYAGLSFATSAGDEHTFGMKMWRQRVQPYAVAYSAALRGQEYRTALTQAQAWTKPYTDRQWHRYNNFYNRIRKATGPSSQDRNN